MDASFGESLGYRLRHTRRSRGATLDEVAQAAGCSESLLSKLENNKAKVSLSLLQRICRALDLTLGALFAEAEDPGTVVVRADKRTKIELDPIQPGYRAYLERLVPFNKDSALQGNIHVIAPGGGTEGMLSHEGEEVGYVICGEIELVVGGTPYRASAGDSFYFRSDIPHSCRNIGNVEARVIFINTPPSF